MMKYWGYILLVIINMRKGCDDIEKRIENAMKLIGNKYNHLTIVGLDKERTYSNTNKYRHVYCFASCDCNNNVKSYDLIAIKTGHTKSCGCSKFNNPLIAEDLTGQTFGRLTVIKRDIERDKNRGAKGGNAHWLCQCSCGNPELSSVSAYGLKNGISKSCGCLASEITAERNRLYSSKYNRPSLYKDNIQEEGKNGVMFWDEAHNNSFIVDKEDAEYISQWYWRKEKPKNRKEGYWVSNAKQEDIDKGYPTTLRLHQMIAERKYGKYDKELYVPDHLNRKHDDNTRKNIKLKTNIDNCKNRSTSKTNKSGKTGVYFDIHKNKWVASITENYKQMYLGSYKTFEEAVEARVKAEKKYGFTCDDIKPEYDYGVVND